MSRFVKHLIIEGGKTAGADLEYGIIHVWNYLDRESLKLAEPFPSNLNKKITKEGCIKIVQFLDTTNVSGKATPLGSSSRDVSKFWADHWTKAVPASTRTPKTDIIIGEFKISLKAGDTAQLMSGAKEETLATFNNAVEKANITPDKMVNEVKKLFNSMSKGGVMSANITDTRKQATDKVMLAGDELNKQLSKKLKSYFETNPKFSYHFAHEAMSGLRKFDGGEATCNYFLVSDYDGTRNKWKEVENKPYVDKISKQMNVSVNFKSSAKTKGGKPTGEYSYWSVLRLSLSKMLKEAEILHKTHGNLLTEADISGFWKKVKNYISGLWKKVYKYIGKSFNNFLKFMGYEPIIKVSTANIIY